MEFDIEQLRRDWIEGVSGEDFYVRILQRREAFDAPSRILSEEDPVEFAVQFFAALSAGATIILANPKWGERECQEFKTLLGAEPLPSQSILIPTGGTTGGVKLAIHNWAGLDTAAKGLQTFLGGGPIDSCCVLPLYHVSGLMQLVRSFVTGGCICFNDTDVEGRCLSFVPTQLQRALQSDVQIEKLKSARMIFVGGAAMPEELAAQVRELRLPVMPVYGMTETAAMCAAVPVEDFLNSSEAGALPMGDTKFSIEQDGRIRIQSAALFQGYQGRDTVDPAQGYVTGDLGGLAANGRLHVRGRADRIIITGGEKVDPSEVERAILKIEGVAEAAVIGVPDSDWGQRVVGFYVHRYGVEVKNWKEVLSDKLAKYKLPKQLIRLDELPRDERGNVAVAALQG